MMALASTIGFLFGTQKLPADITGMHAQARRTCCLDTVRGYGEDHLSSVCQRT
jgi:hypothetical protein